MIVIVGRTGTGKTTMAKALAECFYRRLATYTTRPARDGEKDGEDYHFVTMDEFKRSYENEEFLEAECYTMADGVTVCYGTKVADVLDGYDSKVAVLTPSGAEKVKSLARERGIMPPMTVLMESKDSVIKDRLLDRGDDPAEINRRMESDNAMFEGIRKAVDYVVVNNSRRRISLENPLKEEAMSITAHDIRRYDGNE